MQAAAAQSAPAPVAQQAQTTSGPHVVSSQVPDGPHKVFCGGLPYNLSDREVQELFSTFGPLRAFHLVRDRDSLQSKGYAFFEYLNPALTDEAVNGLNGIRIGEKTLTVRRAQSKEPTASMTPAQLGQMAALQAALGPGALTRPPTRILVLTNMFDVAELENDTEYAEIKEDIETECGRHGDLVSVALPRPPEPGAGKAFLEYRTAEDAAKARTQVEGRQFGSKTVLADYLSEELYAQRKFA